MLREGRFRRSLILCLLMAPSVSLAQPQGDWSRASPGRIPAGAFVGGSETEPLYICRGAYQEGIHPGKLVGTRCNIGWGGDEVELSQYEVLVVDGGLRWVSGPGVPAGAVAGGREAERPLYVCRGFFRGGVHPGKVHDGRCSIGWGGQEVVLTDYEVLLDSGDLRWLAGTRIPPDALAGGSEGGRPLYVCRGEHRGGVHPGKVVAGNCNIAWGGEEVLLGSYEVLTAGPGSGSSAAAGRCFPAFVNRETGTIWDHCAPMLECQARRTSQGFRAFLGRGAAG